MLLLISFFALAWASHHLISGSLGLASRFAISPLMIGLTLVALGTSIPELFFSTLGTLQNNNGLTLDNTLGSNIANIGLVLGITLLVKPEIIHYHLFKKTYPVLIITLLLVFSLILEGYLNPVDGCLFLLCCLALIAVIIFFIYQTAHSQESTQFKNAMRASNTLNTDLFNVVLGLLVLPLATKYAISGASHAAQFFHLNGLTTHANIRAIGSTLPELSTAVIAALSGEETLAIGIILGSNIYNLLFVLAFPGVLHLMPTDQVRLWRDIPIMLFLTLLLVFLNYNYKKTLSLWHGGILLLIYCSYVTSLVIKI